jgi:branched-chain amino acid transport system permease protein
MRFQTIIDGLVDGSIYAIGAIGFSLIYGITGTFHIAYGTAALVAIYIAAEIGLTGSAGYVGLLAGIPAAALIGVGAYALFYRPLERKGRSRTIIFVASLGLTIMLESLIPWVFGADTRNFSFPALVNDRHVLGMHLSVLSIIALVAALGLSIVLALALRSTSYGRRLRALAVNPELAEVMGLGRASVLSITFAIGSALGYVALLMLGMSRSVTPAIGTPFTLIVAIAVLAGGLGSLTGAYVVSLGFGLVEAITQSYLPGQWTLIVVYGVFTLIILIKPTGLLRGSMRAVA